MKAHKIENNVVVNTIVVDSLDVFPNLISAENGGKIGDTWDGEKFIPPVIEVDFEAEKAKKQTELTTFAKSYMSSQMSDYSEWEAISWPLLIAEAEQFQVDGTVGEYMAAEIGVKYPTAADLTTVILQRKEVMKQLRAGVILVRQQKEAAINSASTIEELNLINIQEGWPV